MDIYFNTARGIFVDGWGSEYEASLAENKLKRGDALKIRVIPFSAVNGLTEATDVGSLRFALYRPGGYNGTALVETSDFTPATVTDAQGEKNIYSGRPDANTYNLAAMFHGRTDVTVKTPGSTSTAVLTDADNLIICSHSGAHTFTVPVNSSVAFPTGTKITVTNGASAGNDLTVAAAGGVTITFSDATSTVEPGKYLLLTKTDTDAWTASVPVELSSVTVALEIEMTVDGDPYTTPATNIIIENDYIRENADVPEIVANISAYETAATAGGKYLNYVTPQTLSDPQKSALRTAMGAAASGLYVEYGVQTLEEEEQDQARENINAASQTEFAALSASVEDIVAAPVLYTAQTLTEAEKNVARGNLGLRSVSTQTEFERTMVSGNAGRIDALTAAERQNALIQIQAAPIIPQRRDHMIIRPRPGSTTVDTTGCAVSAIGTATARDINDLTSKGAATWSSGDWAKVNFASNPSLSVGQTLVFHSSGTLPAGLSQDFGYAIIEVASSSPWYVKIQDPGTSSELAVTDAGTGTHTCYVLDNLKHKRLSRIGYVSAGTSGSSAGMRMTENVITMEHPFVARVRFAITDATSLTGTRLFIGLRSAQAGASTASPSNDDPSAWVTGGVRLHGIGFDAADTVMQQYYSGGKRNVIVDGGTVLPVRNQVYELQLINNQSGPMEFYLDSGSGRVLMTSQEDYGQSGFYYQPLHLIAWRNNGANAAAVALDILSAEVLPIDYLNLS